MSKMTGNETAWLEMILNDPKMVESMGLPANMNEEQKAEVIKMILENDAVMADSHKQDEAALASLQDIFTEKEEDESPCDWMLREAIDDLGIPTENFIMGDTIDGRDLEVGEYYMITFPNDKEAVVKLVRILKNSFGDDYIFENISGAEGLTDKSTSAVVGPNEFPLPIQLLASTRFNELKRN